MRNKLLLIPVGLAIILTFAFFLIFPKRESVPIVYTPEKEYMSYLDSLEYVDNYFQLKLEWDKWEKKYAEANVYDKDLARAYLASTKNKVLEAQIKYLCRPQAGETFNRGREIRSQIMRLNNLNMGYEIYQADYSYQCPNDLFFVYLNNDDIHYSCYYSSGASCTAEVSYSEHPAGYKGIDVATSGGKYIIHAPDMYSEEMDYWLEQELYTDESVGKSIVLYSQPDKQYRILIGHVNAYLTENNVTVHTGDSIGRVGGCPDDAISEGKSTGCHSHLVYSFWNEQKGDYENFIPYSSNNYQISASEYLNDSQEKSESKNSITVYMSHYEVGVVAQNDSSPCTGAESRTDLCQLRRDGGQFIALTVDQRNILGVKWKDKVHVVGKDFEFDALVMDEMAKRFRTGCIEKQGACIKADYGVLPGEQFYSGVVTIYRID